MRHERLFLHSRFLSESGSSVAVFQRSFTPDPSVMAITASEDVYQASQAVIDGQIMIEETHNAEKLPG